MTEMPIPRSGGSVAPLWALVNVAPAGRDLLVGWMAAAWLPDVGQPVLLLLRGEHGNGKSTAAKVIIRLLTLERVAP